MIFHQKDHIPTSISLDDPTEFAKLVDDLEGFTDQGTDPRGKPPIALNDSPYGKELNWILDLEDKSETTLIDCTTFSRPLPKLP
ncbi:MAG: hypothetical protein WDO15_17470 [Bacteroidota bacterium]